MVCIIFFWRVTHSRICTRGARSGVDANLNGWDVSNVTTLENTFDNAISFNGTPSGWNVSNVTHLENTFGSATNFDGDLSAWDGAIDKSLSFRYIFTSFSVLHGGAAETCGDHANDATKRDHRGDCSGSVNVRGAGVV